MVPIGVALNKTNPYKETNYSLPTFQQCTSQSCLSFTAMAHLISLDRTDISGQITVAGSNSTGSSSSSGASSSPSPSSTTQSGSKKNSAQTLVVQSVVPWTVLSATALLAGLML